MKIILAVAVAADAAFAAYDFATGRPVLGAFSIFAGVLCLVAWVTP